MDIKLGAVTRTVTGKQVYKLRAERQIPAVLYGHGIENANIQLNYSEFEKLYATAGESTIIDLAVDGGANHKVLVAGVTYDPVKSTIDHVDLQQVNMKEKITVPVEFHFIGEAPIVKAEGGSLVQNMTEVEIRCLPTELIHSIEVDVSSLDDYDKVITIADLKVPASVEIMGHEPEDVVAMVARIQEEVEEPTPAPEGEAATVAAEGGAAGENTEAQAEGKNSTGKE